MFERFSRAARFQTVNQVLTFAISAFSLTTLGTISCHFGGPLLTGVGVTAFVAVPALYLVGVAMNDYALRLNDARPPQVPQPRSPRPVASLVELSKRAIQPEHAWGVLANICGVPETLERSRARNEVAAELANRYPHGLEAPIKQLAEAALLTDRVDHYRTIKSFTQSRVNRDREPLLRAEPELQR